MPINSALFRHTLVQAHNQKQQVIAHTIGGRMSVIVVANFVTYLRFRTILSYDPCTILKVRQAVLPFMIQSTYCTHITLSILFRSVSLPYKITSRKMQEQNLNNTGRGAGCLKGILRFCR
ncbi:hypothetical protein R3P38DRAFT_3071436 [Favolaschia claudopus]|uniref:Uncharacterized protein n=1 Tax=Favolaschia claudopus TaxID=2862362 RepID=A0AAV9ZZ29_9AGAR